jgi:hypothetical protein
MNSTWWEIVGPLGLALVGRGTAMSRRMEPMTARIVLREVLAAICMAVVGAGAAQYLGWQGSERSAMIMIAAYLGPEAIDAAPLLQKFLSKKPQ